VRRPRVFPRVSLWILSSQSAALPITRASIITDDLHCRVRHRASPWNVPPFRQLSACCLTRSPQLGSARSRSISSHGGTNLAICRLFICNLCCDDSQLAALAARIFTDSLLPDPGVIFSLFHNRRKVEFN